MDFESLNDFKGKKDFQGIQKGAPGIDSKDLIMHKLNYVSDTQMITCDVCLTTPQDDCLTSKTGFPGRTEKSQKMQISYCNQTRTNIYTLIGIFMCPKCEQRSPESIQEDLDKHHRNRAQGNTGAEHESFLLEAQVILRIHTAFWFGCAALL